jgi:hypothetical protein
MKLAGIKTGLLMNFNVTKLKDGIKRYVLRDLRALRVLRGVLLLLRNHMVRRHGGLQDHGELTNAEKAEQSDAPTSRLVRVLDMADRQSRLGDS